MFLPLLALVLTGCLIGNYVPPPEATPHVSYSGFDNAKVIEIAPQRVDWDYSNTNFITLGLSEMDLGARWNSARSDKVILTIVFQGNYSGISAAFLNIDGEIIVLTPTPSFTAFSDPSDLDKTSTKEFSTSLEMVEKIINAKRVWMRVLTPTYSVDGELFDSRQTNQPRAYNGLKKFMDTLKGKPSPSQEQ